MSGTEHVNQHILCDISHEFFGLFNLYKPGSLMNSLEMEVSLIKGDSKQIILHSDDIKSRLCLSSVCSVCLLCLLFSVTISTIYTTLNTIYMWMLNVKLYAVWRLYGEQVLRNSLSAIICVWSLGSYLKSTKPLSSFWSFFDMFFFFFKSDPCRQWSFFASLSSHKCHERTRLLKFSVLSYLHLCVKLSPLTLLTWSSSTS